MTSPIQELGPEEQAKCDADKAFNEHVRGKLTPLTFPKRPPIYPLTRNDKIELLGELLLPNEARSLADNLYYLAKRIEQDIYERTRKEIEKIIQGAK